MAKGKKSKTAKMRAKARPKPRQGTLEGMEDRAVLEIEGLAEKIDSLKKKRASAQKQQKELEDEMRVLMTKRHKTEYHRGEIHVWTQERVNSVRVTIGKVDLQEPELEEVDEEVPTTEPDVEVPAFDDQTDGADSEDEEIPGAVGA